MENVNVTNIESPNITHKFAGSYIREIQFWDMTQDKSIDSAKEIIGLLKKELSLPRFMNGKELVSGCIKVSEIINQTNIFQKLVVYPDGGKIKISSKPKSGYFQVFSQNINSRGKAGLSYELGLRNLFGMLETTNFKLERRIGEGQSLELRSTLPYLLGLNNSLEVGVQDGKLSLMEGLVSKERRVECQLNQTQSNLTSRHFKVNAAKKRLIPDTRIFKRFNYDNCLDNHYFLETEMEFRKKSASQGPLLNQRLQSFKLGLKFNISNFQLIKSIDYSKMESYNFDSLLWKKNYPCRIETNSQVNFSFTSSKGLGVFDRYYISKVRGFNMLEGSIPFNPIDNNSQLPRSQLTYLLSLKFLLPRFYFLSESRLLPFWHFSTSIVNYDLKSSQTRSQSSLGVGFSYQIQDFSKIEFIYNFWNNHSRSPLISNNEQVFQLRMSMND